MTTELLKSLEYLKGIWMMGGSATEKAPSAWREAVQQDPYPDLALLALSGQAIQYALQPVPGGKLRSAQQLPRLRLPTPPDPARQQLRHLDRVAKLSEGQMNGIIHLLASRGYAVHPLDYLPKNIGQLPDLYSPWEAWDQSEQRESPQPKQAALSAENWDDWMPAERRTALSSLRRQQPAVAGELIADQAPSLAAEERLRVLEILAIGLSAADQSVLERFVEDRSGKVRVLVQQYLGRIGVIKDDPGDLEEYADFFAVGKRLLKRSLKITAKPLKTDAQKKRRAELAAKLSLQGFVQGLKLSNAADLVSGWEHADPQASDDLVRMVAATGSEQAAALLATRLPELEGLSVEAFQQLFARLGTESRRALLPQVLQNDDARFTAALICCHGMLGEIPSVELKSLTALKELGRLCDPEALIKPVNQETLRQGLYALGLLADHVAAGELIGMFTEKNLFASDPMLGILKLNQCLPPGGNL